MTPLAFVTTLIQRHDVESMLSRSSVPAVVFIMLINVKMHFIIKFHALL